MLPRMTYRWSQQPHGGVRFLINCYKALITSCPWTLPLSNSTFGCAKRHVQKTRDGTGLALIDSLVEKGALHIAVRGKNEATILPLLAFVHREFGRDPTYTPILLEFAHTVLGTTVSVEGR